MLEKYEKYDFSKSLDFSNLLDFSILYRSIRICLHLL